MKMFSIKALNDAYDSVEDDDSEGAPEEPAALSLVNIGI